MFDIHQRLWSHGAIGLRHARLHRGGQFGGGIADIDLATGDVEVAAIERDRLGQPGDGVFGRGGKEEYKFFTSPSLNIFHNSIIL